jgi:Protein of unknown function (DUF1761)
MMKINYLAVAACVVVNMGLGMSWFGVFDQPWMDGHGLTKEFIDQHMTAKPFIATIIGSLVSGYVLSLLFQRMNVTGWQDGVKVGAAIGGLLFFATYASYMFAHKTSAIASLDGGYMFVLYALYGALIGGWQKKA